MKKILFTFFIIFILPISILAYSNKIIVGGESIGINIESNGLEIVGYYKVKGKYINKDFLIGDRIIKIDGVNVSNNDDLLNIINNKKQNNYKAIIIRNNEEKTIDLSIIEENNKYKTGLYIKDSVVGLGTLTYIDPETKIYGSLGHEINYSESNNRVSVKDGRIIESKVTNINKSTNGNVGSKNATLLFNNIIGNIKSNTINGLYGYYLKKIPNDRLYEIETFDNINKGKAYILTVTNNSEIRKYNIDILEKYYSKKDTNKAFSFKVIDDELISKTGGIVQGMSGSPIIQNNKVIGSVTNVVIDNVKMGYGISIITMLEEGDKIKN
jgi:stage IV sporulation protein B